MYIYTYIHIFVYVYMYMYIYVYTCICIYIYIHMCVTRLILTGHLSFTDNSVMYMYISTYIYVYTYICVCIYVYMYVCMCTCAFKYETTHTRRSIKRTRKSGHRHRQQVFSWIIPGLGTFMRRLIGGFLICVYSH